MLNLSFIQLGKLGLFLSLIGTAVSTSTTAPSEAPSVVPSVVPTVSPSIVPTVAPSIVPTVTPSVSPSTMPSIAPSIMPSVVPSIVPSASPSVVPSVAPSASPSVVPSVAPSVSPSIAPSVVPSVSPSEMPSVVPSVEPSVAPSVMPTVVPSISPSVTPTVAPSHIPTVKPTTRLPTRKPSPSPTVRPTITPSLRPTLIPTLTPSMEPSVEPSMVPTVQPSTEPSMEPTSPPTKVFTGAQLQIPLTLNNVMLAATRKLSASKKQQQIELESTRFGNEVMSYESDKAVVYVTAEVLGLENTAVNIQYETLSSTDGSGYSTVVTGLTVLASPLDYPSQNLVTTEDIVNYVSARFEEATEFNTTFVDALVDYAENNGAVQLYEVDSASTGEVTYWKIDTQNDNTEFSTGDFAGLVIGVIVLTMLVIALVYCAVSGKCCGGAGAEASKAPATTTGRGETAV